MAIVIGSLVNQLTYIIIVYIYGRYECILATLPQDVCIKKFIEFYTRIIIKIKIQIKSFLTCYDVVP